MHQVGAYTTCSELLTDFLRNTASGLNSTETTHCRIGTLNWAIWSGERPKQLGRHRLRNCCENHTFCRARAVSRPHPSTSSSLLQRHVSNRVDSPYYCRHLGDSGDPASRETCQPASPSHSVSSPIEDAVARNSESSWRPRRSFESVTRRSHPLRIRPPLPRRDACLLGLPGHENPYPAARLGGCVFRLHSV